MPQIQIDKTGHLILALEDLLNTSIDDFWDTLGQRNRELTHELLDLQKHSSSVIMSEACVIINNKIWLFAEDADCYYKATRLGKMSELIINSTLSEAGTNILREKFPSFKITRGTNADPIAAKWVTNLPKFIAVWAQASAA